MGYNLLDCLAMHFGQPRLGVKRPDAFAEDHENHDEQIVRQQNAAEDSGDDHRVAGRLHPIEQVDPEREANELLADTHGNEHFGDVGVIAIDGVAFSAKGFWLVKTGLVNGANCVWKNLRESKGKKPEADVRNVSDAVRW